MAHRCGRDLHRLVGALLAEQTDEWAITKRYMSAESLKTTKVLDSSHEDPRPAIDPSGRRPQPTTPRRITNHRRG